MTAPAATAADIYVPQGGDLQAAINQAQPGDRILLQPGATFSGNFRLTDKGSSDAYITIRSAASDLLLPGEGVRITPADAPNLPVIQSPNTVSALTTTAGAHHWRLQWLEFRANDRGYGDIISLGKGDTTQTLLSQVPHHLILDRVYVHGDPVIGQKRGVAVHSGATWILNSYISDIKAVGMDTQAIMGYNGPGPWWFINNYLEGAGENVLLGGASPKIQDLVPADIEFRRNYLYKPLEWRDPILPAPAGVAATPGVGGSLPQATYSYRVLAARKTAQDSWAFSRRSIEVLATTTAGGRVTISWAPVPNATVYRVYRGSAPGAQDRFFNSTETTFVDDGTQAGVADTGESKTGTVWTVKNLFELKLGSRVLVDGNVMENAWLQAQTGYAVLFTPRNQDATSPWIYLRDVTFTNNIVRHAGSGIALEGYDSNHECQQSMRIAIRNNLFDDIDGRTWGGSGRFIQIGSGPRDVTIDHNTVVHDGPFIFVYGGSVGSEQQVFGVAVTNNLFKHNSYGIIGGGHGYGNDTIAAYFPDAVITRNVIAGGSSWKYPAGNEFPTVDFWKSQFVDFAGQDYALVSGSPYIASGTDGADLGAPIAALRAIESLAISGSSTSTPPPVPVQVTTASLADARVASPYEATLAASGGSGTFVWSLESGQLPAGLSLSSAGAIAGTPMAAATASFVVKAVDARNAANSAAATLTLRVNPTALSIATGALPSGLAGAAYSSTLAAAGGTAPYMWRLAGGALPPGLSLAASGTLSGAPTGGGAWTATIAVTDSSAPNLSAERSFTVKIAAPPAVAVTSPASGSTITGTAVQLAAAASDSDGSVARVDFYAGTALVGSATAAPWTAVWSGVQPATYSIAAIATDDSGLTATSAPVSVTVVAPETTPPSSTLPPPSSSEGRIVIYAADAPHLVGGWTRVPVSAAASGFMLASTDAGRAALTPLAEPSDYFETTFTAPAGTPYRLWVRMHAGGNSDHNDSLWAQFADSVNAEGAPLYRIGTTDALMLNVQTCEGCGLSGWGWVDGAFWLTQPPVAFARGGTHVVRFQIRQDGVVIDQIVLEPVANGAAAPGASRDDDTILPRTANAPADVVVYAADVAASSVHGRWSLNRSTDSPGGWSLESQDRHKDVMDHALASPSDYFDVTVPAAAGTRYRMWLRMRARKDSLQSDSVWVQFSDALVNGSAAYKLSTTSGLPVELQASQQQRELAAWGWTDGVSWQAAPAISFSYSGLHTLRVQMREDGVEIDQIVLSPDQYLSTSPGAAVNDTTQVDKP